MALELIERLLAMVVELSFEAEHTKPVAELVRDLRLPLALAAGNLAGSSNGALLAKAVTSINETIRGIVSRGWHLSGEALPKQSVDALNGIEEQQLKSFGEWQEAFAASIGACISQPQRAFRTGRRARAVLYRLRRRCEWRLGLLERLSPSHVGFLQEHGRDLLVFPKPRLDYDFETASP